MDENAIGTSAELIFAPIDASFTDDAPLLPSGFRIIPIDSGLVSLTLSAWTLIYAYIVPSFYIVHALPFSLKLMQNAAGQNRTLDLASALEPAGNRAPSDFLSQCANAKSVMTIAFQFAFEIHLQENVAAMARQYVRSIISSVQRVALALSPSPFGSPGLRPPPVSPEADTLTRWICQSYR